MANTTYHIPLTALQAALFARLDSILTVGVLDHSYGNRSFPYASIGEFTVVPDGNKVRAIVQVEGTIHIWSTYEGAKECQEIADTVLSSLTGTPLVVTGYTVIETELVTFSTAAEPTSTELLRHGTLTVRWLIT